MNNYRKIVLKNGTRVMLVPMPSVESATVMSFYEVGSRYEPESLAGVSHFLEHMAFKGTKLRPSAVDISRVLDGMGAEYNAYTDRDNTAYYVRLAADNLPVAIDLLEDMVFHSLYRSKDIESEKGVIIEELKMYEDNPIMHVEEVMIERLFVGSPLGRLIGGTPASVRTLNRKEMLEFRDQYYRPSRTVVVVAGKFDEKEVVSLLERKYGRKQAPKGRDRDYRPYRPAIKAPGPDCKVVKKETEQVQLAIGFPAYASTDPRLPALNVMANILGGTMSSRLFISVREKRGLAYAIRTGVAGYQDAGQLTIQAGLAKKHLGKAIGLIMEECRRISATDVKSEELARARENVRGRLTLHFEDSSHLAEFYGRQELLQKRVRTPAEELEKILAVSKGDVRRVAGEVLKAGRMAMVVIGPCDPAESAKLLTHAEKL
jgi:predicted Zn-dependent peptidase